MADLLFVYGTLQSGFDNPEARKLRARSVFVGVASVVGSVEPVGQYTGFRRGENGAVPGEVYRLNQPEAIFAELDLYEGPEYRRVLVDTEFGPAWVYEYAGGI